MSTLSGRTVAARTLLPLRRSVIEVDSLIDAIDYTLAKQPLPGVTVLIEDRLSHDPRIIVREGERATEIGAAELARDLEFSRVPNQRADLARGFRGWLATRPVPDRVAARQGLVVPTWADGDEWRVRWSVVVSRPGGAIVEWVPAFDTGTDQIRQIRAAAWERSRRLPLEPLRAGDVTVWVHADNPSLSTVVLTRPEALVDQELHRRGLQVVFSPHRPVVCATQAAAERLTEETTEPHVRLPVEAAGQIGWN